MDRLIGWTKLVARDAPPALAASRPGGPPQVFVIDIPGTGPSLELSTYNYSGRVHVTGVSLNSSARRRI